MTIQKETFRTQIFGIDYNVAIEIDEWTGRNGKTVTTVISWDLRDIVQDMLNSFGMEFDIGRRPVKLGVLPDGIGGSYRHYAAPVLSCKLPAAIEDTLLEWHNEVAPGLVSQIV